MTELEAVSGPPISRVPAVLLTGGEVGRLTGGNLYVQRMLQALAIEGISVRQLALRGGPSTALARSIRAGMKAAMPSAVLVDSIVLAEATSLFAWIRREIGSRIVLLMLMLPSDLAAEREKARLRRLEAEALSSADLVIALSSSMREILIAAGARRERLEVVEPGRDRVAPSGNRDARAGGPFRFLCVANWSESKGIHDALRALWLAGGSSCLDLVGDEGVGPYAESVHRLIGELGIAERVRVHGVRERTALARRYEDASAFVLPSRSEGFGTVYAEAFSFGLPVLAYRVPSLSWLENPCALDCALLVAPGDVSGLGRAMAALAEDEALRDRMAAAAKRKAATLPTWQDSQSRFSILIREILGTANDTR